MVVREPPHAAKPRIYNFTNVGADRRRGLDSATQHHVKKGVADTSVTASAHRAAMGGTDASACMKWD